MFLTGFADEAGHDIATQIAATQALGWHHIELRYAGEKNLGTMSDAEFDELETAFGEAGIQINCFGSNIANWRCAPRSDEDFEQSKRELLTAIPRMKRLGTSLVRGMSFKLTGDEPFDSPELERIIFAKVRELVAICEENGIAYGHENCMNYGGQSFVHTLRLLEAVNSPAFTLIFDTGNPVFTLRRIGEEPYPLQSSWEFYSNIREFISYVHIKDCVSTLDEAGKVTTRYTFAGDGDGDVRAIVADLLKRGYDGGFSIEPHVATVFHESDDIADDEVKSSRRFETYVEYGRRFENLILKLR